MCFEEDDGMDEYFNMLVITLFIFCVCNGRDAADELLMCSGNKLINEFVALLVVSTIAGTVVSLRMVSSLLT